MDLGLAGRVALVCGSTKGLGRAVAKALAQEGARVAVNGRHDDAVEHVAQQLASETRQTVLPFVADVGVEAQAEALVERVHHEMGRLDVLFCNASGPPAAPFSHQTAEAFHRAVELNLLSAIHLSRSEEHTSELQSRLHLVCRLLLEKKKNSRWCCRYAALMLHFRPDVGD